MLLNWQHWNGIRWFVLGRNATDVGVAAAAATACYMESQTHIHTHTQPVWGWLACDLDAGWWRLFMCIHFALWLYMCVYICVDVYVWVYVQYLRELFCVCIWLCICVWVWNIVRGRTLELGRVSRFSIRHFHRFRFLPTALLLYTHAHIKYKYIYTHNICVRFMVCICVRSLVQVWVPRGALRIAPNWVLLECARAVFVDDIAFASVVSARALRACILYYIIFECVYI